MKFKDTAFFKDLIQKNELPSMQVETFVSDETLYKSGLVLVLVVIVSVLIISVLKEATK